MFGRVFELIEEIVAPSPNLLQNFEYNWKLIKTFFMKVNQNNQHIDNTNIPYYMDQMLQVLIKEENEIKELNVKNENNTKLNETAECLGFFLESKSLDLLVDLAISEKPVGCRRWVLKWIKKYLTCLENPVISHESVFKPIIKLITVCKGALASPYEMDEILFLEAVAGLIKKNPDIIRLFVPSHQQSDRIKKEEFSTKPPKHNILFQSNKLEPSISRVSIMMNCDEKVVPLCANNNNIFDENADLINTKFSSSCKKLPTDCNCYGDRFVLLDVILSYIESPDSTIVVRACEAILILVSLKELDKNCNAINASLTELSHVLGDKLFLCAELIPEDMDLEDIEECNVSWGLFPKDDKDYFIGRFQLTSFLCWLDYVDCLVKENLFIAKLLGFLFREQVLEKILEPNLLELNESFGLALGSKVIRQIKSEVMLEEIATWLVGTEINGSDCLLNIIIENAQDNADVLLQTLQFVEALLENPNERILHSMIFIYLYTRGYYGLNNLNDIGICPDKEELTETLDSAVKSRTMAPNNILKVINNFLLLLPRQLMAESVGTCYEEYMHDASRHYQIWIKKTSKFNWPIEATSPVKRSFVSKSNIVVNECNDSGISDEYIFFEGPLLRLLFNQIKNMNNQPYELNLASIAILSKLAMLPNPYLHEILLCTEIPVAQGAETLFTVIKGLSKKILSDIPRYTDFSTRIRATANRLLSNPPQMKEKDQSTSNDESEQLFEALIVLEEFCKELAAIAFIKYHHATE